MKSSVRGIKVARTRIKEKVADIVVVHVDNGGHV
jgi:hypothetical protein